MITSACEKFVNYSFSPLEKASALRAASIKDDGTWGEALTARALFIAQAIVNLAIVPLTLLGLIFAPALALCIEGKEGAGKLLKNLSLLSLVNIAFIPTNLISAFVPHSLEWEAPASLLGKCLNKCVG
jgi:hypothetical protein